MRNVFDLIDTLRTYEREPNAECLHTILKQADSVLITTEGRCDWANIQMLEAAGFRVHAGEQDSFGWLTGVIKTKAGDIVYG
jgi:hypothetical protein